MSEYTPSTKQERKFALAWRRAAEEAKRRWPGKTSKQGGFISGAMWQRATGGSPDQPSDEWAAITEHDRQVAERAWDEGCSVGSRDVLAASRDGDTPPLKNPYRKDAP